MADAIAAAPARSAVGNLWWTARNPPIDPTASFAGKTILITGPTAGLGFEAALKFARLGAAKLVFGVRSLERGRQAKEKIERTLDGQLAPETIELLEVDMSIFSSVKSFAHEASTRFGRIDIAVLNAGMVAANHDLSPEGWESSLQINALSTAYLALLLLPKLRQTAALTGSPTHLEFVGSCGHGDVKVESIRSSSGILDKVNDKANFSIFTQYTITKLLEHYAMDQISQRVSSKEVVVFAVCPSLCKSDLGRNANFVLRKLDGLSKSIIGRTAEQGSRILVSGCTLGQEAHGEFWSNDRISKQGILMTSEEGQALGKQVWTEMLLVFKKNGLDIESIL